MKTEKSINFTIALPFGTAIEDVSDITINGKRFVAEGICAELLEALKNICELDSGSNLTEDRYAVIDAIETARNIVAKATAYKPSALANK